MVKRSCWVMAVNRLKVLLLAAGMLAFVAVSGQAQVVINELMADNSSAVQNEGDYPDWVELFNTSYAAVNISGWKLTDTATNVTRFSFPSPTWIPARSYLVIYCDSATNSPGIHTLFGLSRKGSYLGLYDSIGNLKDSVTYGLQVTDLSIGRYPDGSGAFQLNTPSPLTYNKLCVMGTVSNLFINEWAATNSNDKDWIELYNATNKPVSIGGLVFSSMLPLSARPTKRWLPSHSSRPMVTSSSSAWELNP